MDFLHRRRPLLLLVAPVVMLIFGHPANWERYAIGVSLAVIGQTLRIWSAGHISKCRELAVSGPFSYVRNPLYLGSFVILIGYSILTGTVIVWAPIFFLFIVTHWGAVVWEEGYLREIFGKTFDEYCRRVPRLIPRLTAAYRAGGFSLQQAWMNREQISALSAAGVVVVFALKLFWSR